MPIFAEKIAVMLTLITLGYLLYHLFVKTSYKALILLIFLPVAFFVDLLAILVYIGKTDPALFEQITTQLSQM